jgi:hypothetical protein
MRVHRCERCNQALSRKDRDGGHTSDARKEPVCGPDDANSRTERVGRIQPPDPVASVAIAVKPAPHLHQRCSRDPHRNSGRQEEERCDRQV